MGYDVLAKAVLREDRLVSTHQTRYTISLTDKLIRYQTIADLDVSDIRLTNGIYAIRFNSPRSIRKTRRGRSDLPFTIATDLLGFHLTVRNAMHFRALAKVIPELAWMIRNTNYDDELFHIAENHVGIHIPFCLDVVKYHNKLKKQAIAEGERNPELFAGFVSFNCAQAVEKNFSKTIPAPKSAVDYGKELADAYEWAQHTLYDNVYRPHPTSGRYVLNETDRRFLEKKGYNIDEDKV